MLAAAVGNRIGDRCGRSDSRSHDWTEDWTGVSDARLDAHIASFYRHRYVHCRRDPDVYDSDTGDEHEAAQACEGCPILLACREQALRLERGAGESWGIRGGLTAAARQQLIEQGLSGPGRTILPATVNTEEALELLAARGYAIRRNTLQQKAAQGNAPKPMVKIGGRLHWDARALMQWDFTVGLECDYTGREDGPKTSREPSRKTRANPSHKTRKG